MLTEILEDFGTIRRIRFTNNDGRVHEEVYNMDLVIPPTTYTTNVDYDYAMSCLERTMEAYFAMPYADMTPVGSPAPDDPNQTELPL